MQKCQQPTTTTTSTHSKFPLKIPPKPPITSILTQNKTSPRFLPPLQQINFLPPYQIFPKLIKETFLMNQSQIMKLRRKLNPWSSLLRRHRFALSYSDLLNVDLPKSMGIYVLTHIRYKRQEKRERVCFLKKYRAIQQLLVGELPKKPLTRIRIFQPKHPPIGGRKHVLPLIPQSLFLKKIS